MAENFCEQVLQNKWIEFELKKKILFHITASTAHKTLCRGTKDANKPDHNNFINRDGVTWQLIYINNYCENTLKNVNQNTMKSTMTSITRVQTSWKEFIRGI